MAKESGEKTVCAAEKRERDELLHPQDYRMHLKKRDFAIMGVLTLVYGAVAFYHLGATKAPQTGYVSTAAGETVVLDLGENQEDFHLSLIHICLAARNRRDAEGDDAAQADVRSS